jgi:DNA-binding MarR family transcriptional regulator
VTDREDLIRALAQEMPRYISAAVQFQVAIAHQLDMPVTDVHALAALLEAGPMGVTRLADMMGTTVGAVTRMADRLERRGYVRRMPDPQDRRRVVVHVVPERMADVARFYEPMDARWHHRIRRYSPAELRFLLEFLRQGRADARPRRPGCAPPDERTARGAAGRTASGNPDFTLILASSTSY